MFIQPNRGRNRANKLADVSLKSLHESVFSTFRFGTASPKAAVGTSMARVKLDGSSACLPPSPSALSTQPPGGSSRRHNQSTHSARVGSSSGLTTLPGQRGPRGNLLFDVRPDAPFLSATESVRHQRDAQAPNHAEKQKAYTTSLREQAVIPTDQFLQRKRRLIERRTQRGRQTVNLICNL